MRSGEAVPQATERAVCERNIEALREWNLVARALLVATETVLTMERAKLAAMAT